MLQDLLLPPTLGLHLEAITLTDAVIFLTVTATAPQVACPQCRQLTAAIHSRYPRRVADLSVVGVRIQMNLHVRKFFCQNPECSRKIFAERLTPFINAYARRTSRSRESLEQIALDLGGESGACLATKQSLPISHDTRLRWLRTLPESELQTPRVLGVDDWAKRKGQTYGTILVDLETHQPIELLPDREADTLARWLEAHPGAEVITRDRAGAFAEGAQRGAPNAQQVADRFHLLQNLRDAVQRLMDRQQQVLRQVVPTRETISNAENLSEKMGELAPIAANTPPILTQSELRRQRSRTRRQARYAEVHQLKHEGLTERAIARKLKTSRHTVKRFLAADTFPERAQPTRKSSILDPYLPCLEQQLRAGHTDGTALWRQIRAKGFLGSRPLVSRWVTRHRDLAPPKISLQGQKDSKRVSHAKSATHSIPVQTLSARRASWLVVRHPDELDDEQQQMLQSLCELSTDVQTVYPLVQEFTRMVRTHSGKSFDAWLHRVRESKVRELVNFAKSLIRDRAAVLAGLDSPFSNGQVEGLVLRQTDIDG